MKVLIINTSDIKGGAARAAYRLHQSLRDQNIDSQMLVQDKYSDNYMVERLIYTNLQKIINKFQYAIDELPLKLYSKRDSTLFSSSLFKFNNIVDEINAIAPDIVHLHWICGGLIKIEELSRIKAPIVWSLHDMWAFTGGCHYDKECGRYTESCGSCKVLGSTNAKDLSRKVFNKKKETFTAINNITIIGLSKWLSNCAKKSTLFKDKKHIHLPNPIDTNIFKPFDKIKSRELWNLPQDKKLLLFGAMDATSDPRKGFKKLNEALKKLKYDDIELVVFGSSQPKDIQKFGFKTHYLGNLTDDISLVSLYSAVDIMVVSSLQENLSNIIMESLSCATPVVGFDIGGNSDMIEHKSNGYLAKPLDTGDLAKGIEWILNNKYYDDLCENARDKIVKEFDSKYVSTKYITLYKKVLEND